MPDPGDFGLVHTTGRGLVPWMTDRIIEFGTDSSVCHAFTYVGGNKIVEAVSRVECVPVHYSDIIWSTGKIALTDTQREQIVAAAMSYVGQHYNALDIVAIALAQPRLGRIVSGDEWWVKRLSDDHMQICSQAVVNEYRAAGKDLFPGKLSGLVSPGDLYRLLR